MWHTSLFVDMTLRILTKLWLSWLSSLFGCVFMFICVRNRPFEQAITHQSPAPALKGGYNYVTIWKRLYEACWIWCCQLALSCSLKSLMHGSDLLIASWAEESLNVLRFQDKNRLSLIQMFGHLIFSICAWYFLYMHFTIHIYYKTWGKCVFQSLFLVSVG